MKKNKRSVKKEIEMIERKNKTKRNKTKPTYNMSEEKGGKEPISFLL